MSTILSFDLIQTSLLFLKNSKSPALLLPYYCCCHFLVAATKHGLLQPVNSHFSSPLSFVLSSTPVLCFRLSYRFRSILCCRNNWLSGALQECSSDSCRMWREKSGGRGQKVRESSKSRRAIQPWWTRRKNELKERVWRQNKGQMIRDNGINMGRKNQHKALKTELAIWWKELRTVSKQMHNLNGNGSEFLAEALWMLRRGGKQAAENL